MFAPLRVSVAPDPLAAVLMVPEMLYVIADAVKFSPMTLAPLTVTDKLDGVKVNPLLLAVIV